MKDLGCAMPRILVFFTNTAKLTSAYSFLSHHLGQAVGDAEPQIAMFTKVTSDERKAYVLNNLNSPTSTLKVVLCTSSLSVGVNLAKIKYVIHYGLPVSVQDFLQESGRAAREADSIGFSILLTFPHMVKAGTDSALRNFASKKCNNCRRAILLEPFNVIPNVLDGSICCDICHPDVIDPIVSAAKTYHLKQNTHLDSDSATSSSPDDIDVNLLDRFEDLSFDI